MISSPVGNNVWTDFYQQNSAEGMFSVFTNILEKALKICAPMKTASFRNDKNKITLRKKMDLKNNQGDIQQHEPHRTIKNY